MLSPIESLRRFAAKFYQGAPANPDGAPHRLVRPLFIPPGLAGLSGMLGANEQTASFLMALAAVPGTGSPLDSLPTPGFQFLFPRDPSEAPAEGFREWSLPESTTPEAAHSFLLADPEAVSELFNSPMGARLAVQALQQTAPGDPFRQPLFRSATRRLLGPGGKRYPAAARRLGEMAALAGPSAPALFSVLDLPDAGVAASGNDLLAGLERAVSRRPGQAGRLGSRLASEQPQLAPLVARRLLGLGSQPSPLWSVAVAGISASPEFALRFLAGLSASSTAELGDVRRLVRGAPLRSRAVAYALGRIFSAGGFLPRPTRLLLQHLVGRDTPSADTHPLGVRGGNAAQIQDELLWSPSFSVLIRTAERSPAFGMLLDRQLRALSRQPGKLVRWAKAHPDALPEVLRRVPALGPSLFGGKPGFSEAHIGGGPRTLPSAAAHHHFTGGLGPGTVSATRPRQGFHPAATAARLSGFPVMRGTGFRLRRGWGPASRGGRRGWPGAGDEAPGSLHEAARRSALPFVRTRDPFKAFPLSRPRLPGGQAHALRAGVPGIQIPGHLAGHAGKGLLPSVKLPDAITERAADPKPPPTTRSLLMEPLEPPARSARRRPFGTPFHPVTGYRQSFLHALVGHRASTPRRMRGAARPSPAPASPFGLGLGSGASLALQARAGITVAPGDVDGPQASRLLQDLTAAERGQRLPSALQASMEHALGADFADVRIHTGTVAQQMANRLGADAFTIGHHIAFRTGQYAPASLTGKALLAHELMHVVQQSGQGVRLHGYGSAPQELEAEARQVERIFRSEGDAVDGGLHVACYERQYVNIGPTPLHRDTEARLEAISLKALEHCEKLLAADTRVRIGRRQIERLSVEVDLDLERMSDAEAIRCMGEALAQAVRRKLDTSPSLARSRRAFQAAPATAGGSGGDGAGPPASEALPVGASREEQTLELQRLLRRTAGRVQAGREGHLDLQKIREEQWIVGAVSDILANPFQWGGLKMPEVEMWDTPLQTVAAARKALDAGRLDEARMLLHRAGQECDHCYQRLNDYREGVITGTERAVTVLQGTAVAGGIAATVATGGAAAAAGGGLLAVSAAAGAGAGAYGALSEGATQSGEKLAGTRREFEFSAMLRRGLTDSVTGFVGALAGGALSGVLKRCFGAYLRHAGDDLLLELGKRMGLNGPLPRDFFLTKAQQFAADFFGGLGAAPLTTAVTVVLDRVTGAGPLPDKKQFVQMVVDEMIQGGIMELFLGAFTAKFRGMGAGKKSRSGTRRTLAEPQAPPSRPAGTSDPPVTRRAPDESRRILAEGGKPAIAEAERLIRQTADWKGKLRADASAKGALGEIAQAPLLEARRRMIGRALRDVSRRFKDRIVARDVGSEKFTSDRDVTFGPPDPSQLTTGAQVAEAIEESGKAARHFTESLRQITGGEPEVTLDANAYSWTGENVRFDLTPEQSASRAHQLDVASLAEMRRSLTPEEWRAFRKQALDQASPRARGKQQSELQRELRAMLQQQFDQAERLHRNREHLLEKAYERHKAADPAADDARLRSRAREDVAEKKRSQLAAEFRKSPIDFGKVARLQSEIKLLDPTAYATESAFKDVVQHQQAAKRARSGRDAARLEPVTNRQELSQSAGSNLAQLLEHLKPGHGLMDRLKAVVKYCDRIEHARAAGGGRWEHPEISNRYSSQVQRIQFEADPNGQAPSTPDPEDQALRNVVAEWAHRRGKSGTFERLAEEYVTQQREWAQQEFVRGRIQNLAERRMQEPGDVSSRGQDGTRTSPSRPGSSANGGAPHSEGRDTARAGGGSEGPPPGGNGLAGSPGGSSHGQSGLTERDITRQRGVVHDLRQQLVLLEADPRLDASNTAVANRAAREYARLQNQLQAEQRKLDRMEAEIERAPASNAAQHERYKQWLWQQQSQTPSFKDPAIYDLVYHDLQIFGDTRLHAEIGSGSTADAIRYERAYRKPVGGKYHSIKGQNAINALSKYLRKQRNRGETLDPQDHETISRIIADLQSALTIPIPDIDRSML